MKILLKTTEQYRVDNEDEAVKMIEKTKDDSLSEGYTLTKSSYVIKTKKSKGEVIDSWAVCTLEKKPNRVR